jgi:hypothetical protein
VTLSPRHFQKTSRMCIATQNTATISLIHRDSTAYSFFRHGCALKPKTLRRFVKFVVILRRIPFFVTNTATICLVWRDSTTYSYFSSRTCIDGYWSPNHHDDLLNSSQYGPQHHDVLADSSRSLKKQPPHQHLGPTHTATQAPPQGMDLFMLSFM